MTATGRWRILVTNMSGLATILLTIAGAYVALVLYAYFGQAGMLYLPNLPARGTLLFFHGNAGNISHRLDSIRIFHNLRLSVFIFDYRGYGRSEGQPREVARFV